MTYLCCKTVIEKTTYTSEAQKEEMQVKLDVFFLNNRINQGQYNELTDMLAVKPIEE
jgi:hypothetical protein